MAFVWEPKDDRKSDDPVRGEHVQAAGDAVIAFMKADQSRANWERILRTNPHWHVFTLLSLRCMYDYMKAQEK